MEIVKLTKMITRLFSLKGRQNYTKDDVIAWAEQLQRFDLQDIDRAFARVIRQPGFLDIGYILQILDPAEPRDSLALVTWERLVKIARAGGEADEVERQGLPFKILDILGGMGKLQRCENEFILSQMKKNYIDIYTDNEAIVNFGRKIKKDSALGRSLDQLLEGPAVEKITG